MNSEADIYKDSLDESQFYVLCDFIRKNSGINISGSKKILLESRIRRRLKVLGIKGFADYMEFLFSSDGIKSETINLIDVVTTNKTDFFREFDHFTFLEKKVIPDILKFNQKQASVWSVACSSGEEPYSIIITFLETMELYNGFIDFLVLGTDISTMMLEKAKNAIYPEESSINIKAELLRKYFLRGKEENINLVKISKRVRERLILKRLNLIDEYYDIEGKFDVIFCRNVLIYFSKEDQGRIVKRILRHLNYNGYIFLGHSEVVNVSDFNIKRVSPSIYKSLEISS